MKRILFLLFCSISFFANAQKEELPYIKKEFLIIHSSKDYESALKKANEASKKLKIKIALRDLKPNKEIGLSYSNAACEDEFGFFPCYVARGRYDDGIYVSIEYSDAYLEFEKGYYIVVLSSFINNDAKNKNLLVKAKKIYKDAYLKASKVYVGCIH